MIPLWITVKVDASTILVFLRITLPLSLRGMLAGTMIAFERVMGEFGATLMVACNLLGRTQALSTTTDRFLNTYIIYNIRETVKGGLQT